MKHSTASDTDTKKSSRWFRATSHRGEIDQLLDLYWGGPERRITGLTLRIIGINVIALLSLLVGVFSLGQYQNILIQSKLSVFQTELFLLAAAFSQSGLKDMAHESAPQTVQVYQKDLNKMTAMLAGTLNKRILLFDNAGHKVVDSNTLSEGVDTPFRLSLESEQRKFQSLEILKNMASFLVAHSPGGDTLEPYVEKESVEIADYVDAQKAMSGEISITVWRNGKDGILLTAAMPVLDNGNKIGVVMLYNDGDDIKNALGDAWFGIVRIFAVTLFITIFLSIYLSGVIARPLRKLAQAAERVRRGKVDYTEIPDMSNRHDEIGELSLVLRDMTYALSERMDSIETFAADVAHEIKNPLTSLKSAVETAHIVKKKEQMDKLLMVIQHDVERLDRLITDISHASRLDAELSRESFEKIELRNLMRNLVNVYKKPLDRNHSSVANVDEAIIDDVKIRLVIADNHDIWVIGSEIRLIQVFQNIIANALSFSAKGSTVLITMETALGRVTLSFEDEGPGIPENKLKTVFERFYSQRPEHESFGRHSGLGLSICKQIITAHKGIIFAENRKDHTGHIKGARFIVILNTTS